MAANLAAQAGEVDRTELLFSLVFNLYGGQLAQRRTCQ
jgi:hypothetical protein